MLWRRIGQHFLNLDIGLPIDQIRPLVRGALDAVGAISLSRVLGVLASWPFLIGALAASFVVGIVGVVLFFLVSSSRLVAAKCFNAASDSGVGPSSAKQRLTRRT